MESFSLSLSLSLLLFVSEKEGRSRGAKSFLSFSLFPLGGNYSSPLEGNLNAKRTQKLTACFFLSLLTAITCSSSWCVLLFLSFFHRSSGFLFNPLLFCRSLLRRIENEIRVGCVPGVVSGDLLFSLSLSLCRAIIVRSSVWSLIPQHTHS